ncbi:MAG: bifunctional 4-hydroxy-2-oxoglutarate aldolase/2-dehydro-3-deoxy-phosphogluconate aldolase [Bacteroidales bacterium]|nr:bifunctional 4-hydroxy-2-oxoglutarate aldolase/2-dehydro-3-deoxy-phosphogluconate aldolase [Bacteroidales bacterium]
MFAANDLPILGILRNIEEKDIAPLVEVFIKTGIRHIEITMNTPGAELLIRKMADEAKGNLVVGAGTVLDSKMLFSALESGASFIVSPSTKKEIVEYCVNNSVPVFPGALTPTEVHMAWDYGATMVKLFPSGMYGPGYIKALKGPFDSLKIIAVGGINEGNVAKFIAHGADAVAFGAGIIRPVWLEEGKFDIITDKIRQLTTNCREAL